jgi:hypothetical protein
MQTHFFSPNGYARKKKNFIYSLESDGEVVISQATKHEAIYKHFLHHTGTCVARHCSLNFNELGWEARNLEHLELPFNEEEIKR